MPSLGRFFAWCRVTRSCSFADGRRSPCRVRRARASASNPSRSVEDRVVSVRPSSTSRVAALLYGGDRGYRTLADGLARPRSVGRRGSLQSVYDEYVGRDGRRLRRASGRRSSRSAARTAPTSRSPRWRRSSSVLRSRRRCSVPPTSGSGIQCSYWPFPPDLATSDRVRRADDSADPRRRDHG